MSFVAYTEPGKYSETGRPREKGKKINLKDIFNEKKDEFIETTMMLYGKEEKIKYLCVDLLWGKTLDSIKEDKAILKKLCAYIH